MSGRTWVAADHHFGHASVLRFKGPDGVSPLRPFESIEEHDEEIIARHNALVAPGDRVYLLGDLCLHRRAISTVARLNGRKVLVKGNHDIFKLKDYLPYLDDIRACVVHKGVILTHIPIHADQLRRFGTNVHGHLHAYRVLTPGGEIDERYKCVSLEHTNFSPIQLYEALERK